MSSPAESPTHVSGPPSVRFLSVREAALALGVPRSTVRLWCKTGRLPAVRMGKAWRISVAGLDDLVAAATRPMHPRAAS